MTKTKNTLFDFEAIAKFAKLRGESKELLARELKVFAAWRLYADAKISAGMASEIAGMEKSVFLNYGRKYHNITLDFENNKDIFDKYVIEKIQLN